MPPEKKPRAQFDYLCHHCDASRRMEHINPANSAIIADRRLLLKYAENLPKTGRPGKPAVLEDFQVARCLVCGTRQVVRNESFARALRRANPTDIVPYDQSD